MVWHYDPCKQPVPLAVEEQERILHHARDGRFTQYARAVARVHPSLNSLAAFGIPFFRREASYLPIHSLHRFFRHAVGKMKCYMLNQLSYFEVRQVPTTMPPGNANLLIGGF